METAENQKPEKSATSIGVLLKTARERKGQSLEAVTNVLRIRLKHLKAIELGKYEELPGKTYAIGFVKSYSEYLGLDGEEIVRLFKEEVAELKKKQELYILDTGAEASVPSYFTVFIALLVAFLVYFGWTHRFDSEMKTLETVDAVPENVAAKISEQPENLDNADINKQEDVLLENSTEKDALSEQKQPDNIEVLPVVETPVTPVVLSEPDKKTIVENSAETIDKKSLDQAEMEKSKLEKTEAIKVEVVKAEATKTDTEKTTEKTALEVPENEETPVEKERNFQFYGQENTSSKVLIKANAESWVQVSGKKETGESIVYISKVFYKDDQYLIPNKEGLFLDTGNAGGLDIIVDGNKVDPIGAKGTVKRNVPLDVNNLLGNKNPIESNNTAKQN